MECLVSCLGMISLVHIEDVFFKSRHDTVIKMNLLSTNVKSPSLKGASLLIHGTCLKSENKRVFDELSQGRVPLEACLEETHMNIVGFKIATILRVSPPAEIVVLTMNGSPHCVQLHFVVEQAIQLTNSALKTRHLVVEKDTVHEVTPETVRLARHLGDLSAIIKSSEKADVVASRRIRKT